MKIRQLALASALTASALLTCAAEPAEADRFPSTSVYQLTDTWTNQNGQATTLDAFHGKLVVVAMFFSSCEYVCPRMIADMQRIEQELDPATRPQVHFVLASFDTQRDTPERLKQYAGQLQLPETDWTLLHGDANTVRNLAAVLGVTYKRDEDGNFAHSVEVSLLDRDGTLLTQEGNLGAEKVNIIQAIRARSTPPL